MEVCVSDRVCACTNGTAVETEWIWFGVPRNAIFIVKDQEAFLIVCSLCNNATMFTKHSAQWTATPENKSQNLVRWVTVQSSLAVSFSPEILIPKYVASCVVEAGQSVAST